MDQIKFNFLICISFGLLLFFPLTENQLLAQQSNLAQLNVQIAFQNKEIALEQWYRDSITSDSFLFETLKFYLGDLRFKDRNKVVFAEANNYHLMDLENPESLNLLLPKPNFFSELSFNFGIDSLTNAQGIHEGDLDPLKGMYWIWQTGYIQLKMEGKYRHRGESNNFEYHIGGFQKPYGTCFPIKLLTEVSQHAILQFDLSQFFQNYNYLEHTKVMSPGENAYAIGKIMSTCFKLK